MTDLRDELATLPLVDHHVHGALTRTPERSFFEHALNEGSPDPAPAGTSAWDCQLGFAIRARCAPLLGLPVHAAPDDYWARRVELGEDEVTRRLAGATGVGEWLLDTGFVGDLLHRPDAHAALAGGRGHEVVRIEAVAEELARGGVAAGDFPDALRARLSAAAEHAVGFKTIVAYRAGFDLDWAPPSDGEVVRAAGEWLGSGTMRVSDPVLLRFGIHTALALGRPLQFHVGFGDRDLDLHQVNPLLLTDLLRRTAAADVPVMLLHCYPFHREAGYLAQAFGNVYCDVGLALNHVGVRSAAVVAESLELAPFGKVLFSSDAWGPAELHLLGAWLWRDAMATVLGSWVEAGAWSAGDALRVARMIGSENARRVYRLPAG